METLSGRRPAPRRTAGGVRLATRLAVRLALLVSAVTAGIAWTALSLVGATFQRQLEDDLIASVGEIDAAIAGREALLGEALAGLERHLRRDDPALLERLLLPGARLRGAAAPLMRRAGLDVLDLLDVAGDVISSGHYPDRVDLSLAAWIELPTGRAALHRVAITPVQERLTLLQRRRMTVGRRVLELIGGTVLDERLLEEIGSADAALLLDASGGAPLAAGRGAEIDAGALRRAIADAGEATAELVLPGAEGARWLARSVALRGAEAEPLGRIMTAVDGGRLDALLARMRRMFVLLGVVAVALAALAGSAIARGVTRPVAELVRAVDAIARGEADYTFPGMQKDEFEELVASFSRLQRSLETQQMRAAAVERVAAWREVARHVAHEVKNPLAPIRLTVQNLQRARREVPGRFGAMFDEGMDTILDEVEQLSRLVGEFSEFARLPLPTRQPVDVEALLDEVVELYAAEPGLILERRRTEGLPRLALDRDQVSRALKNVIGNAVDAMRESRGAQPQLAVRSAVEDDMLRIEVQDSGPGFSTEAARRIFEPYFTTKGGGTGLGMAITYRIITEHGGVVAAENAPGGGGRVVIRLPLRPADRAAAEGQAPAPRNEVAR